MTNPEPLPGTHLAAVDCNDCGEVVLAVPDHADDALCTACWNAKVDSMVKLVSEIFANVATGERRRQQSSG